MSAWRAIATVFGPVADRPDADAYPYGTQWHDPETGITYGTDEVQWYEMGSRGAGGGAVGPWTGDGLVASDLRDLTAPGHHQRTVLPICAPTNVGCFVVHLSDEVTYGQVAVQLTVNGVLRGQPLIIDSGNCSAGEAGIYVTVCDLIGFRVETSSDLEIGDMSGPGLDATVMAQFAAPVEPIPPEIEARHGIVFGHSVEFDVEVPVEMQARHGLVLGHSVEFGEIPPADPFGSALISELVEYEGGETTDGGTMIREDAQEPP